MKSLAIHRGVAQLAEHVAHNHSVAGSTPAPATTLRGRGTTAARYLGPLPRVILLLGAAVLSACATLAPGSDPVVVRTQDVLVQSMHLYDSLTQWHRAHSREESPEVYAAIERLRPAFPKAWRGLRDALNVYRASKTRDTTALRTAGLKFLDEVAALGPEDWKASILLVRQLFEQTFIQLDKGIPHG